MAMATINIQEFEESFVIHFGTEFHRINAYTLASTLVAVADAAKAANVSINPGYEIEVLVEALGPGSFKAQIRAITKSAANLFTGDNAKNIVLGVIASFIFEHTLSPDKDVSIVVNADEVVVEQGDNKIVIPRQVHAAVEEAKKSAAFRGSIGRAFGAVERDSQVGSIGLTAKFDEPKPLLDVPRQRFASIAADQQIVTLDDIREVTEITTVQIMRAILEPSRRRWEFVWQGVRISAPVLDERFFADFAAHKITIAPGDALEVRLKLRQKKDGVTGIYVNDPNGYEVLEVVDHLPRLRQTGFSNITR